MAARATFQQNEKRRGREGEKKVPRVIDCDCCSQLYRSQEVAPRSYHCIHSSQKSACCFYPPTPPLLGTHGELCLMVCSRPECATTATSVPRLVKDQESYKPTNNQKKNPKGI